LQALSAIIRDIVGPAAPQQVVVNSARSIVGQMLFYHFARPMLVRVFPNEPLDASKLDELADHITAFSLQGLRGISLIGAQNRKQQQPQKKKGARR
jgi:hypothetical protein